MQVKILSHSGLPPRYKLNHCACCCRTKHLQMGGLTQSQMTLMMISPWVSAGLRLLHRTACLLDKSLHVDSSVNHLPINGPRPDSMLCQQHEPLAYCCIVQHLKLKLSVLLLFFQFLTSVFMLHCVAMTQALGKMAKSTLNLHASFHAC